MRAGSLSTPETSCPEYLMIWRAEIQRLRDNYKHQLISSLISSGMDEGVPRQHNSKRQTPISKIKRNNRAYTNKAEIADQFNKHFVNVGQTLAKRIENCDGSPTQFIRSTPVASFVMSCVTETQVCSLFKAV